MPRKGTKFVFTPATLPILLADRTAPPPPPVTFKGNFGGFIEPPPVRPKAPEATPRANNSEAQPELYYKTVKQDIATVGEKMSDIRKNPDLSPSEIKNMSRKLGRDMKFLESIKVGLEEIVEDEDHVTATASEGECKGGISSVEDEDHVTATASEGECKGGISSDEGEEHVIDDDSLMLNKKPLEGKSSEAP